MMRPFKAVSLGAAAALAVVLSCAPVASAATRVGGGGYGGGEKVFELIERTTSTSQVDVDKNGLPSAGDLDVFTDDLFSGDKKVGTDAGVCTIVSVDNGGQAQCQVTLSLEEGQITVQGLISGVLANAPIEFDVAITGGTGDFSKARGYVHGSSTSETEVTLEVHLNSH